MKEAAEATSKAKKVKRHSEESKKKIRETEKGKHWYNNGKENKYCYECPPGFVPGRIK